jgi:hypothetical protein
LFLHNYNWVVHELDTYIVPYTMSCGNSYNLSNNIHAIKICWIVMKLQMFITIQKLVLRVIARLVANHPISHNGGVQMGPMKSKPHFMNGLVGSMVINFAIGICNRFSVHWHASQDWQCYYASLCKVAHQYLASNTFQVMMFVEKCLPPTPSCISHRITEILSLCKHWHKIWSCLCLYNFSLMMVKGNTFNTKFFGYSMEYPSGIFLVKMYVCTSCIHFGSSINNDV